MSDNPTGNAYDFAAERLTLERLEATIREFRQRFPVTYYRVAPLPERGTAYKIRMRWPMTPAEAKAPWSALPETDVTLIHPDDEPLVRNIPGWMPLPHFD